MLHFRFESAMQSATKTKPIATGITQSPHCSDPFLHASIDVIRATLPTSARYLNFASWRQNVIAS